MGSDNIFKKRKARKVSELSRQQHLRNQSPRYLIICEGEKTEPQYFNEILQAHRIPSQRVKIERRNSSSPAAIVEQALLIQSSEAAQGDPYDKIYCVFDRDLHTTFDAAIDRINAVQETGTPIVAITSTPCFEFWMLLHFEYTDAPFQRTASKSIGDQAVSKLRKKPGFEKYTKGQTGIYKILIDLTPKAVKHAARIRKNSASRSQIDANPWTNVDILVAALQELSKK